jgi:rfaE bifunctional protein kinase chain/domain
MNLERLTTILNRFPQLTLLVIGDFFLDKYLILERALAETSLETGLEAHQVVEVRCSPGAAGTITSNLRAMEVNVIALSVLGDDGEGFELIRGLHGTGVDVDALIIRADRFTPTYTKPMLREPNGSAHELNRLDIKNRSPLLREVENQLMMRLHQLLPRVHGIIVADQVPEGNCGILTDRIREEIILLARKHPDKVFLADSRERIGLYTDVMLKPNEREATRAIHGPDAFELDRAGVLDCGQELYRGAGKPVFLTLGADGIVAFHADGPTHVPAVRVEGPIDIVGAGDATMAGIASAMCAGATVPEAAEVGCLAAGVTIQQIGTTGTASQDQIAALVRQMTTSLP